MALGSKKNNPKGEYGLNGKSQGLNQFGGILGSQTTDESERNGRSGLLGGLGGLMESFSPMKKFQESYSGSSGSGSPSSGFSGLTPVNLSSFSQKVLSKLGLPDLNALRNFQPAEFLDKINIFKGIKPPAWLSDEFHSMFNNFPQWWQQKVGSVEQFFDANNPNGMVGLIQRLMPTDLITAGIHRTKEMLKGSARTGWAKMKEFARERPGVTSLSLAAFFLPIFAPMAL